MKISLFCGIDRKIDNKQIRRETIVRWIKRGFPLATIIIGVVIVGLFLNDTVLERDLRLGEVSVGTLETTVTASGKVIPTFEEIINSPVDSRIVAVYVQSGDSVKAGMPLLQLDLQTAETDYNKMLDQRRIKQHEISQLQLENKTKLSELAMQIKVAEMEVAQLKVEVRNERRLDSLGCGTGDRVREAETAYAKGQLQLKQLQEKLENERRSSNSAVEMQRLSLGNFDKDIETMKRTLIEGKIPAPHSGVVTYINNEIGSRIAAGEKVAVVSDLSNFKIEGQVAEASSDRVLIGSEVAVRIGKEELLGTVANISPQSKDGVVTFIVNLENPRHHRLRSGLRNELYVSYGYKDNVMRLPNGAYFKGPGTYNLFVADGNDMLVRRVVKLEESNREYVEVVSGLHPGDRVVISDMENYKNSKKLKIKK